MKNRAFLLLSMLLLLGCGSTQNYSVINQYTGTGQPIPKSVLIMPPINNSNNINAKEFLYSTLATPLIERGYYVFPPYLSLEVLQRESAYDAENFLGEDLSAFGTVFGAEAALFTIIHTWQKGASSLTANIEYVLVSVSSNEVLCRHSGETVIDTSISASEDDDYPFLRSMVSAVSTAVTPMVKVARTSNSQFIKMLPPGPYSRDYTGGNFSSRIAEFDLTKIDSIVNAALSGAPVEVDSILNAIMKVDTLGVDTLKVDSIN